MSRKVVRPVVAVLLLANLIFNACTSSNSKTLIIRNQIEHNQLSGKYVRENLDTEERLVLRNDGTYKWTQLVLQPEIPVSYSHTGKWDIKGSNIVLSPKERLPEVFKSSLRYVMLNIDGNNVLLQKESIKYVNSPQQDRFTYIRIITP